MLHQTHLVMQASISQLNAISQHSSNDEKDDSQLSNDAAGLDEQNDPSANDAKYLVSSFDCVSDPIIESDCSADAMSSASSDGNSAK